jgi:glycosyltransferase involved in cell wall biosynthesis
MQQPSTSRVTVIVPCRNELNSLPPFLACLSAQELSGIELEVLVADGMSGDGTRELLRQFDGSPIGLRVIDNPRKVVSTGLNRAICQSESDILIRMDVHTQYAPDYIRRCVEVLNETGADNVGGPVRTTATGYTAAAIALAFHTGFGCGGAKFHNPEYEGPVDTVPYGCWRRSTLQRIGLFDESLHRNQDDELNLRLVRAGGRIWQCPRIVSWYQPRRGLSALFRQYLQYGYWKVAVIRKHRTPAAWRHLVPPVFVASLILLPSIAAICALSGSSWFALVAVSACGAILGLYALLSLCASIAAARHGGWRFLAVLPAVFAAYHVSYGAGFLLGLIHVPGRESGGRSVREWMTGLTR